MVGLTPTLTLFRNLICQFWIKMISEQFFSSENMQITQTVTVFFFTRKPPAVLLQSWRTHKPITQIVISLDIMFLFCALCSFCLVITVRQCSPNKGITVVFFFYLHANDNNSICWVAVLYIIPSGSNIYTVLCPSRLSKGIPFKIPRL